MSLKPGVATSNKMKKLIELSMKQTLNENKKDIDLLLKIAGTLEYLVIDWNDPDLHLVQFVDEKYNSIEEVPETTQRCIRLAIRYDTSQLVFFDLWREFGQAVRELMCSNYDSIPRSLRWMIEACVFWAYMQLDYLTAREMFEHFCSQRDKLTEEEFNRAFSEIYSVNEGRLAERLTFKEKFRRLAVKEIIENLSILKNHSRRYKKGHLIRSALRTCYSVFSKYSHISLSTMKEIDMEPGELHVDFAFFQDFHYDKERFDIELRNIYTTLDLIMAVMILVETEFFCYETPHEFFECLGDRGKEVANKIGGLHDRLPFISNMITGS